jgi:hypothetical protein
MLLEPLALVVLEILNNQQPQRLLLDSEGLEQRQQRQQLVQALVEVLEPRLQHQQLAQALVEVLEPRL